MVYIQGTINIRIPSVLFVLSSKINAYLKQIKMAFPHSEMI